MLKNKYLMVVVICSGAPTGHVIYNMYIYGVQFNSVHY